MTDKLELYFKAAQSAKIGIWKMNLETNHIFWDMVTKCILEVSDDFEPVYGSGINFYTPGPNRERIAMLVEKASSEGISF